MSAGWFELLTRLVPTAPQLAADVANVSPHVGDHATDKTSHNHDTINQYFRQVTPDTGPSRLPKAS